MTDTCILRFRDIAKDATIRSHRQIISSSGSVWWGWWKKQSEPDRRRELDELREKCRTAPITIGLFDRSTAQFFFAVMSDCVVSPDGPVVSPDRRRTPGYYSEERLPAWFQLTSIEEVSSARFEQLLAPVPQGDGTFFPIWRERRNPNAEAVVEVVRVARPSILHLSDIHFGVDFGFPREASPGKTPLLEIIERDFRDDPPGLIIVSGDITSRADANVLQDQGLKFLNSLSQALRVPKECFVIVPGNHDIALQDYRPIDYSHEAAFNLFAKEFHGRPMTCPELRRFSLPNGRTLELLAMNSVRLRHKTESQFGYVQWPLYDDLLKSTHRNPEDLRIAVLHHHLVPASREEGPDPNYPEAAISITVDAGAVLEGLQAHGFKLALHGHQHVPAVTRIDRGYPVDGNIELNGGLVVIAAGSAGANRLSDEMRDNSYNVIRFSGSGFTTEARRFNQGRAPQRLFHASFED